MSLVGVKILDLTFTITGDDITGYRTVYIPAGTTGDDRICALNTTDVNVPLGVAQIDDDVTKSEGDQIPVRVAGESRCYASKAIAPGDIVAATLLGNVTDAAPAAGEWALGIAQIEADDADDPITVFISRQRY